MEERNANLTDPTKIFDDATKVFNEDIIRGSLNHTKDSGEKFEVILQRDAFSTPNTQYLIMAKAVDNAGTYSEQISNMAHLCNNCAPPPQHTALGFSGGEIFGIIIGALLLAALCGFVILAVLVYAGVVKKPDIKIPEMKKPDFKIPEMKKPDIKIPESFRFRNK